MSDAAPPPAVPPPPPPPPPGKSNASLFIMLACGGCGVLVALGLVAIIVVPGFLAAGRASNDRNASASLKTLITAEADFRSNDRDENGIDDYWTADVCGLYDIEVKGSAVKLIELSIAMADAAPVNVPSTPRSGLGIPPATKSGYSFAAIRLDRAGRPYHPGTGRNPSAFGFCCWPTRHPNGGKYSYIVNEDAQIWKKDNGGLKVDRWPADLAAEGWTKLD